MTLPGAHSQTLSYDAIFGEDGRGRYPTRARFADDGRTLAFLYGEEDESELWVLKPGGGTPEILVRTGQLEHDGSPIELDSYQWMPGGRTLLLPTKGVVYRYDPDSGSVERLTDPGGGVEDPKVSPDGKKLAFVRAANLWWVDLETGRETQVTEDGVEDRLLYGKTDWVYWEELWGRSSTGFWWSPDSRRLALYRFDEEGVGRYPLLDSIPLDPEVTQQPYPRAGEKNPDVAVGIIGLDGEAPVWLDTTWDEETYLPRVFWTPDAGSVIVERLNRAQNRLDFIACDPASGACRERLSERSGSWIDIENDTSLFEDGSLLFGSDRDGHRRLYLSAADDGTERALTPDGLTVSSLDRVLEANRAVYYTAYGNNGLGAKNRTLYRLDLDSGENRRISPAEGWTSAVVSATGDRVETRSSANEPRTMRLVRDDGAVVDLPQEAPAVHRNELPEWEFLTIPGPDDVALPARMMRPTGGSSVGGRHPVLMYHYGGPASQVVVDASSSRPSRDLWHVRQAQRGYVVLQVDNAASLFFGKNGAARLYRRFGELELEAQLAAVEFLRGLDFVDPDRIGLWGWSGGGSNTLYSILHSPGTWAAAVAGAPVTDWRLYDTIWTERYLGHPADNEVGYRDSSAVTAAGNLADPLLLVHGTADDNVHPSNTLVLSQKLVEAGLPFEQAIYPRQKHGFDSRHSRHFYERMEAFFDRHLLAIVNRGAR